MAIGTLAAMPFRRHTMAEPHSSPSPTTPEIDLTSVPSSSQSRWNFEAIAPEETHSPAELPSQASSDMVPLAPVTTTSATSPKTATGIVVPPNITSISSWQPTRDDRTLPPDLPRRFEFPLASLKTSGGSEEGNDEEANAELKTHQIRKGDTLEKIAMDYLGSANKAEEIFELNRSVLVSPDLLPIGKIIKLPKVEPADLAKAVTPPLAPFPALKGNGIQEPASQPEEEGMTAIPAEGDAMPLTEL